MEENRDSKLSFYSFTKYLLSTYVCQALFYVPVDKADKKTLPSVSHILVELLQASMYFEAVVMHLFNALGLK